MQPDLPISRRLAPLLDSPIVVVDVGARDAGPHSPWTALPNVFTYGFDPDAAEVARLNEGAENAKYFPYAVGGEAAARVFYDNNAPGGGSFYPQNCAVTDRWKFENIDGQKRDARDYFYPTEPRMVPTVSLDAWAKSQKPAVVDLIKLNIQGAELDALRGAEALVLPSACAVFLEVSFVESYIDRPMFADVDTYMRAAGFEFFDLLMLHPVGRAASPYTAVHARAKCPGQLIEAHALYLRPLDRASLKLACIAEAFGQVEYAFEVLQAFREQNGSGWLGPIADASDAAAVDYMALERAATEGSADRAA